MSYFENKIYIQTAHQGVRNMDILNVNTSSDFCVFTSPSYSMVGADKIMTGTTSADTLVHIISTATTVDLVFTITANTESISGTDTTFRYEIHKLDSDSGLFPVSTQYISAEIPWSGFTDAIDSATTETISIDRLDIDGEYLIKNSFTHEVCTDFASRLGYRNDTSLYKTGDEYGLYNGDKDFYMSIFRHADTPQFDPSGTNETQIRTLRQQVVIPYSGQTYFIISSDISGDFLVTLNGLVLSKDFDYSVGQFSGGTKPNTVTLSATTNTTDIVSFIYSTSSTEGNGLKSDVIDVSSITSGKTDLEGSENIYYNTDTSKYEVFLELTPTNSDDILLILNGATLANGVDYYQSISNPKRLILIGTIFVGDIITIVYNQGANFVGDVNTATPTINWTIEYAPSIVNGHFVLELASDSSMVTQISSASTIYEIGTTSYSLTSTISGTVGTEVYYRVSNIKDYETVSDDIIQTVAYSDIIPITIATNAINSY